MNIGHNDEQKRLKIWTIFHWNTERQREKKEEEKSAKI